MTSIEDELYDASGSGTCVYIPSRGPAVFPPPGVQPARQVQLFWALRLRPLREKGGLRFSNDFQTCVVRPLTEAVVSYMEMAGGGTYEWTPLPQSPAFKLPYIDIGLQPMESLAPVNPTLSFTIMQTATHYVIHQHAITWEISRPTPNTNLILSFADVAWTVRLTDAEYL